MGARRLFRGPAASVSWAVLLGLSACALRAVPVWAQTTKPAAAAAKAKSAAKPAKKEADLPAPESVDMTTRDGVLLKATFYPGGKGKQTVPVVLLHMYKGSRNDYGSLAADLQRRGHAVLVPDLRGHGASTQTSDGQSLEAGAMPPRAFAGMIEDIEACKRFLREKNNAGELNIERLCLVAAEMTTPLAMRWAELDWSWPVLATGKQGQDVKALILLSPTRNYRGLNARDALTTPALRNALSLFILVGKDDPKQAGEARGLFSMLARHRPGRAVDLDLKLKPRDPNADPKKAPHCTLFYLPLETRLEGTKLIEGRGLPTAQWIAWFIQVRLVNQDYPWKERGDHF